MSLSGAERRAAGLAAVIGNALEWFDFAVYGYVATPLGAAFFPAEDRALQAIAAFGVFAVGYLMRPVGSLLLGPIGDLLGRRLMLSLSILLMGASSLAIGLLPTHAQWGAAAGLVLVLLRMLQGLSLGGEFTGSMTYATEAARRDQRGLLSSLAPAGGMVGFSLGAATVALLAIGLGPQAMAAWGWRVPFLIGSLVAVLGLVLRRGMPETLSAEISAAAPRRPAAVATAVAAQLRELAHQWRLVVRIGALVAFANVVFYVMFVYFVDYNGSPASTASSGVLRATTATSGGLSATTVTTVLQTLGVPLVILGGGLADRLGRVRANRLGNLALALVTPLAVALAQRGGVMGLAGGQMLVLLPVMATIGAQGVLAVELVPPRQRCTVFSLAYSLSMALFAGSSPLVCSWLLQEQGWTWAPALYCSLFAIPALAALRGLGSRPDGGHDAGVTAAA